MSTTIATYRLKRPCGNTRPFCRACTNTFAVDFCGPTHCKEQPASAFCLKPRYPVETCQGCGHPVAVMIRDFRSPDGLTLEGDPFYRGDHLLLPQESVTGNSCCWYHQFPVKITTDGPGLFIPSVCNEVMEAIGVQNANLKICVGLVPDLNNRWEWTLTHTVAGYSEVTRDYPFCQVEAGRRFQFFSGTLVAKSEPFLSINCEDSFQIFTNWIFGQPMHPVTVEFFDLTGTGT